MNGDTAGRNGQGPVLEFRNVSYRVRDQWILREITLTINEGETLVLLGRSGAGKTTLLKMVNGLVMPTEGEVLFEGNATGHWDLIRLRRRIGYVIQDAGLFPHRTVEENVGLVPRLEEWPLEVRRSRVELLLNLVGLPPDQFAARYPRSLSGGQKQRVGVARALAADPPLLLLDEPFGALDPILRLELQRQFIALRQSMKKTAVFVTHDVREALSMATRIALLKDGRLQLVATPVDFLASQLDEARAFLACIENRGGHHDAIPSL
jgi:osmoprotectant transport system ATP-binding protein